MASEAAVRTALLRIAAVFPREFASREALAATARVWAEALSDLADAELQAAVRHCLRTCRFAPRPAEVLAARGAAGAVGSAGSEVFGGTAPAASPNVLTEAQFARRKAAGEEFFRRLRARGIMGPAAGGERPAAGRDAPGAGLPRPDGEGR